jgi:hypothetical protein
MARPSTLGTLDGLRSVRAAGLWRGRNSNITHLDISWKLGGAGEKTSLETFRIITVSNTCLEDDVGRQYS